MLILPTQDGVNRLVRHVLMDSCVQKEVERDLFGRIVVQEARIAQVASKPSVQLATSESWRELTMHLTVKSAHQATIVWRELPISSLFLVPLVHTVP